MSEFIKEDGLTNRDYSNNNTRIDSIWQSTQDNTNEIIEYDWLNLSIKSPDDMIRERLDESLKLKLKWSDRLQFILWLSNEEANKAIELAVVSRKNLSKKEKLTYEQKLFIVWCKEMNCCNLKHENYDIVDTDHLSKAYHLWIIKKRA